MKKAPTFSALMRCGLAVCVSLATWLAAAEFTVGTTPYNQRTWHLAEHEVLIAGESTAARVTTAPAASVRDWVAAQPQAELADGEAPSVAYQAVVYPAGAQHVEKLARFVTDQVAVQLSDEGALAAIEALPEVIAVEEVPYGQALYLLTTADSLGSALHVAEAIDALPGVANVQPVLGGGYELKSTPNDPLYSEQWGLVDGGTTADVDVDVEAVWGEGLFGKGINIAILDTGTQLDHEDLVENIRTDLDEDYFDGDTDASPEPWTPQEQGEHHGTFVSGLAAARGNNGIGISGVAQQAGLVPLRVLGNPPSQMTDTMFAGALAHLANTTNPDNYIHVHNNSWGPQNGGLLANGPDPLRSAAIEAGVRNGRGGLGTVYVFSSGNDGGEESDYEYPQNDIRVMSVGALNAQNERASYSSGGSNVFVTAPAGNGSIGSVSTDREGAEGYVQPADTSTESFEDPRRNGNYSLPADGLPGTSFSTPIVAGVIALMLEKNPKLTFRDVQHIIARTADANPNAEPAIAGFPPFEPISRVNAAGFWHHLGYGFGNINAKAAVDMAGSWSRIPKRASSIQLEFESVNTNVNPLDHRTLTFPITDELAAASGVDLDRFRVERVSFGSSITIAVRGFVDFHLRSPNGTLKRMYRGSGSLPDYAHTINAVSYWGEQARGDWELTFVNQLPPDGTLVATWNTAAIELHGYQLYQVPVLSQVAPAAIAVNNPATLTLIGQHFQNGATVGLFVDGSNEVELETRFISENKIEVDVPTTLLASTGTKQIKVRTLDHTVNNGESADSNALPITIVDEVSIASPVSMALGGVVNVDVATLEGDRGTGWQPLTIDGSGAWSWTVPVDGVETIRLRATTSDGQQFISQIDVNAALVNN